MQTVIQVLSTGSTSLRDRIVRHKRLGNAGLHVAAHKKLGRAHGWAKLKMEGSHGALNVEWHAASRTLICRVVTRGGDPDEITSAFVGFLLKRMSRQIRSIVILP